MTGQGANPDQIFGIITQVTAAMSWVRVGAGETIQYVQNPYEAKINPSTPDGLNLYLKEVEEKEKDEDQIKIYHSNSKVVVTCMKDLIETFGWSVITSKIDDPKDPEKNLVNIFTSMR